MSALADSKTGDTETSKNDDELTESERDFAEFLHKIEPYVPQMLERWMRVPRETRLEMLAHGQAVAKFRWWRTCTRALVSTFSSYREED